MPIASPTTVTRVLNVSPHRRFSPDPEGLDFTDQSDVGLLSSQKISVTGECGRTLCGMFNDAGLNELGINAEHIVFLHRKSRLPAFRISLIQGVHHYHWRTLWYQAEYFFTGCQHIP